MVGLFYKVYLSMTLWPLSMFFLLLFFLFDIVSASVSLFQLIWSQTASLMSYWFDHLGLLVTMLLTVYHP